MSIVPPPFLEVGIHLGPQMRITIEAAAGLLGTDTTVQLGDAKFLATVVEAGVADGGQVLNVRWKVHARQDKP